MPDESQIYHVRASGLTLPGIPSAPGGTATGRVLKRGEEFTVTPELYEATKDRNGASWLDMTPEAQVKRWGMVRFHEGPAPVDLAAEVDSVGVGADDESVMYRRGIAAREYARAISDPAKRAEALKEVQAKYGHVLSPRAQGAAS